MSEDSKTIVTELKRQNELLEQLLEIHEKQAKHQKRHDWNEMAIRLAPIVFMALLFGYLYWEMNQAINELTSQVDGIRTSVESMFGLLTENFGKIQEYFTGAFINARDLLF